MAYSTTTETLPYFDTRWAVLSTIGACYVFVGIMVVGIRGRLSALLLVLIVVSAGCAIANGVHYYEALLDCPPINQAVAVVIADVAWMIQEAGLPFYGYIILVGILRDGSRIIFLTLFWVLMLVILVVRIAIMVVNVRLVLDRTLSIPLYSILISRMHIGYFLPIAMAETISAIFLLKTFRSTLKSSTLGGLRGGKLFRYLTRSTEIRVAMVALVGIARTITFSFNVIGKTTSLSSLLDGLVYTVGSIFPIVLFIDVIATRQAYDDDNNARCNELGSPVLVDHAARSLESPAMKRSDEHHKDEIIITREIERTIDVSRQESV